MDRRLATRVEPGGRGSAAPPDEELVAHWDDLSAEDVEVVEPRLNAPRLVRDTVALARERVDRDGADPRLPELVKQYWRLVPDEELVDRTPAEMLDATVDHLDLAGQRMPGELKLRMSDTPDGDHTVVDIIIDDMPFLVDSVTAALTGRRLDIHLVVHPQVVVRREVFGKLVEVEPGVEPEDAEPGDLVESWMRLEIDHVIDEDQRVDLRHALTQVLTDVRDAVEDWPKMRTRALSLADDLGDAQLPVPDKDISDSVQLLRWLADDHFTFLGYREYRLADSDGQRVLKAVLGTGLGILRTDQTAPRVLSTMTPEAY